MARSESIVSSTHISTHLFDLFTCPPDTGPTVDNMPRHVGEVDGSELGDESDLCEVRNQQVVGEPGGKEPRRD